MCNIYCDLLLAWLKATDVYCHLCFAFTVLEAQLRASDVLKPVVCGLKIDEICLPGNTLLWDLLQDQNIVSIGVVMLCMIVFFIWKMRRSFDI